MRRPRAVIVAIVCAFAALASVAYAITVTRVTVGTTPTLLYVSSGGTVLFRNAGASTVYLGDATVATITGFELLAGDGVTMSLWPTDSVYAIVASGTVVMHMIESKK